MGMFLLLNISIHQDGCNKNKKLLTAHKQDVGHGGFMHLLTSYELVLSSVRTGPFDAVG